MAKGDGYDGRVRCRDQAASGTRTSAESGAAQAADKSRQVGATQVGMVCFGAAGGHTVASLQNGAAAAGHRRCQVQVGQKIRFFCIHRYARHATCYRKRSHAADPRRVLRAGCIMCMQSTQPLERRQAHSQEDAGVIKPHQQLVGAWLPVAHVVDGTDEELKRGC